MRFGSRPSLIPFSPSQNLGYKYTDAELLEKFNLTKDSPAKEALPLINSITAAYSDVLDSGIEDGKSRLLAAYSKMASKEEALILADNLTTKAYQKSSILRGRTMFLTYLSSLRHKSMDSYTVEDVLNLYKDPMGNLLEIISLLSHVTPSVCEGFLATYTSKNQESPLSPSLRAAADRRLSLLVCAGHRLQ